MLRREKIEFSEERTILSNMIMSTALISKCRKSCEAILFESTMGKIVADWVLTFYDKYGEAPQRTISDIYIHKAADLKEADAEMVKTFLDACSDEWTPSNEAVATENAIRYFQKRTLVLLAEKINRSVQNNDIPGGLHAVADFTKPDIRQAQVVDLFRDSSTISSAFDNDEEEIFTMPGVLGSVIGPFIREDFIAVIGPPKSGKTWWLMTIATQAALQGKCVLYVSLEMSEKQVVRRFWQMLMGMSRHGEEVAWPVFQYNEDRTMAKIVDGHKITDRVDSSIESIEKAQRNFRKMSRRGHLELRTFPTGTLTVRGLEAELKDMEVYEGFVPEVICVDYADIMDLGPGNDEREKINKCWKALRGLAQSRKCMLATVSQTGRATVGGEQDAAENQISEDIRKVAHVTKMITINHTPAERKRGITRLACNTTRDGAPVQDSVVCTSCLAIGRPYLECELLSRVDMSQEEQWDGDGNEDMPKRQTGRRTGSYGRYGSRR